MSANIVIVDYADLTSDPPSGGGGGAVGDGERRPSSSSSAAADDLMSKLGAAFGGPDSAGLVAIRNVPGFVAARDAFLPLAHPLAHLPPDYLESDLTDSTSLYNAGWSRGKERLGRSGRPDLSKGSFYFNPLSDEAGTEDDRRRFPASYPRNVWPDEERLPGGFEEKAKTLGRIMHEAVVVLARHIDAYASMRTAEEGNGTKYPPNLLYDAMRKTDKAKGRLLYYFPLESDGDDGDGDGAGDPSSSPSTPAEDSWIGWHNDSGFLTALAGDMYVDDDTGRRLDPSSEVDGEAGLYVVDRTGGTVKVDIPEDCLAVQIGECTQIVTGGAVVATPHCVRGARSPPVPSSSSSSSSSYPSPPPPLRVARISCPCFIDAHPSFPLRSPAGGGGGPTDDEGGRKAALLDAGLGKDRVPPLRGRWTEEGMPFGDFLARTFAAYYD